MEGIAAAVVFFVVGVVAVGGGLLLYALVRAEHSRRQVPNREEAERVARRDR